VTDQYAVQVGVTQVTAHRRPIVGVLSTGSELVEAFSDSTPEGKIRDSNRPMLLGLLEEWEVETIDLGICSDKKDALRDTLKAAFEKVDVLITSGGVSMVSQTIDQRDAMVNIL
jgi:gephyrin